MTDMDRANYKSMDVSRLLTLRRPKWMAQKEWAQHSAVILSEVQIRGWRKASG